MCCFSRLSFEKSVYSARRTGSLSFSQPRSAQRRLSIRGETRESSTRRRWWLRDTFDGVPEWTPRFRWVPLSLSLLSPSPWSFRSLFFPFSSPHARQTTRVSFTCDVFGVSDSVIISRSLRVAKRPSAFSTFVFHREGVSSLPLSFLSLSIFHIKRLLRIALFSSSREMRPIERTRRLGKRYAQVTRNFFRTVASFLGVSFFSPSRLCVAELATRGCFPQETRAYQWPPNAPPYKLFARGANGRKEKERDGEGGVEDGRRKSGARRGNETAPCKRRRWRFFSWKRDTVFLLFFLQILELGARARAMFSLGWESTSVDRGRRGDDGLGRDISLFSHWPRGRSANLVRRRRRAVASREQTSRRRCSVFGGERERERKRRRKTTRDRGPWVSARPDSPGEARFQLALKHSLPREKDRERKTPSSLSRRYRKYILSFARVSLGSLFIILDLRLVFASGQTTNASLVFFEKHRYYIFWKIDIYGYSSGACLNYTLVILIFIRV